MTWTYYFFLLFISTLYYRAQLPQEWSDRLDDFQKIIFLKCLRPDKVTNAMQDFVSNNLGQKFIEPQVCISVKIDTHYVFESESIYHPSKYIHFLL